MSVTGLIVLSIVVHALGSPSVIVDDCAFLQKPHLSVQVRGLNASELILGAKFTGIAKASIVKAKHWLAALNVTRSPSVVSLSMGLALNAVTPGVASSRFTTQTDKSMSPNALLCVSAGLVVFLMLLNNVGFAPGLAVLTVNLAQTLFVPLSQFLMPEDEVVLLLCAQSFAGLLALLFIERLVEQHGSSQMLWCGLLMQAVSLVLFVGKSLWLQILSRFCQGVAGACCFNAGVSLVMERVPGKGWAWSMTTVLAVAAIGSMLGPLVAAWAFNRAVQANVSLSLFAFVAPLLLLLMLAALLMAIDDGWSLHSLLKSKTKPPLAELNASSLNINTCAPTGTKSLTIKKRLPPVPRSDGWLHRVLSLFPKARPALGTKRRKCRDIGQAAAQ